MNTDGRLALTALCAAATLAPVSASAQAAAAPGLIYAEGDSGRRAEGEADSGPDGAAPAHGGRGAARAAAGHRAGHAATAQDSKDAERGAEDDWLILDRAHHVRRQAILLSAGAWADRVTAGIWYGLPLGHEGILPHINDAIILDLGGDYTWLHDGDDSTHGLWLAVGPRWNFYLTRAWTLYAAFHVGLFVTVATSYRHDGGPNFFQPGIGMGGLYRVSQRLQLGLDFSYPQGLRFGLNIDLDD